MSFIAHINFTQNPWTKEVFDRKAEALNFAKRIYRDGYVREEDGKTTFYPSNIIAEVVVEESDEPAPVRPLGHGL